MRKQIALAAVAASVLILSGWYIFQRPESAAENLTVVSFGGAYQAAQVEAYVKPYERENRVAIQTGEYNGEFGLLSERSKAAAGTWDVVSVESGPALRGELEGIFATLPSELGAGLNLVPGALRRSSAGHLLFSTLLGHRSDLSPAPKGWNDFFDLTNFPGKRALRNNPRGSLEIALLADGVDPQKLYPLDVERALAKLNTIKDQVVFWESGAQPIQLLTNNVVVMTSVYNGRIWEAANVENLPLAWVKPGGLFEMEFWAVPINSRRKDRAFDFIRFSLEKQQQAHFAGKIAYVPTNLDAMELIAPEIRRELPDPGPDGGQIMVDAEWWAKNEEAVSNRWNEWKLAQ